VIEDNEEEEKVDKDLEESFQKIKFNNFRKKSMSISDLIIKAWSG